MKEVEIECILEFVREKDIQYQLWRMFVKEQMRLKKRKENKKNNWITFLKDLAKIFQ